LKWQIKEQTGRPDPDYIIACVGGGSNAAGSFYHYLDNEKVKLIAVEAAGKGINTGKSAATIALGSPGVIHGSKTMLMQNDDGQIIETIFYFCRSLIIRDRPLVCVSEQNRKGNF